MLLHTHSQRLEHWLGADEVERISDSMRGWYGPPIPIRGVPGSVFAARGGDFVGPIDAGRGSHLADVAARRARGAVRRWSRRQQYMAGAGFASLGDLISEATSGKARRFTYYKIGTTGGTGTSSSLWRVGPVPAAGAAAAAAPGGTVPTSASTGAISFGNPTGGDTQHLVRMEGTSTIAGSTLLLYDRIFAVAKTMNSAGIEAVSGVPTRYQSTTSGAADSAEGNFLFPEIGTVLAGTNHNWTVCQYTDQSGNPTITLPSITGINAGAANRMDMSAGGWFAPLDTGDTGIKDLTQMQCSTTVATGTVDFVIGHPLAVMPNILANAWFILPMINDAFSLERVFDGACLAFLEMTKVSASAATYNGMIQTVSG